MYVPSLDSLLHALDTNRSNYKKAPTITVPKEMFEFLVQGLLEQSDFNEVGYLSENPDVAEAARVGNVEDVRRHYIGFGYFEGRLGGTPTVDERWYLTTYPDVAMAVKLGKVRSANEHYNVIGGSEGRSPNVNYVPVANQWKRVLVTSQELTVSPGKVGAKDSAEK